MRPIRRSEDLELFGRQPGVQRGDRLLQLAGRHRASGDVVGQLFLEGEGIARWVVGVAIGAKLSGIGAGRAGTTRAMIGPWRRQRCLL
ncbi:hypothetical protein X773_28235 [Mesorhizobium sp. LSJC285A00]|uniref:hypothetical protein n=1 Tax=unclassified Mesorhizobium TaxID=325217 RepID=UPI0003CF23E9|nr:hypothetical protein [Mesorhizobium sp. LSJC285A00]ESW70568.1 hypothetical protein X773_28235 [Mesorhizobium sp. LSJC285A00]